MIAVNMHKVLSQFDLPLDQNRKNLFYFVVLWQWAVAVWKINKSFDFKSNGKIVIHF